MTELRWRQPEDTRKWVGDFKTNLARPCAVLLSGGLGAGKTQIVRWFLAELGAPQGSSPTFAVWQAYPVGNEMIDHVDLYRLRSDADLESCGFWDLLQQPQALLFVEWAERLPANIWPQAWRRIFIDLQVESDQARVARVRIVQPKLPL